MKKSSISLPAKTITIRPSTQTFSLAKSQQQQQQIIVIPQSMLVNGCISAKDLKTIINSDKEQQPSIKTMENRESLKRPGSSDSCYGSDSEISESSEKSVRKRANLDHLSPEEKLMRRKLKNRVAAQNARDKKRVKFEEMEGELQRLKAHAKALELKNAELVAINQRLVAQNDALLSSEATVRGQEAVGPLVTPCQPPESAAGSGSARGRWVNSLDSLTDGSLQVVARHPQGQQATEEVANQEAGSMADVVDSLAIKSEDFEEDDAKACEQILDKFLEMTHEAPDATPTILDTAWEETFSDLFPELGECTF